MDTKTRYTGKDMFAVLDVVEVEVLPYEYNVGLPVGERHSFKAVAPIRTMVFVDVDDAVEYASEFLGRPAATMHNRKCEAHVERDGKIFRAKFRHVAGRRMDDVVVEGITPEGMYI